MSLLFELKNEFGGFVDYEWFTAKIKKCSRRPRDGHLVIEVHFPGDIGDTTVDGNDASLSCREIARRCARNSVMCA